ncbi:MAG TPA: hypothetical protein VIL79_09920 [Thermoleophilia bacterium]
MVRLTSSRWRRRPLEFTILAAAVVAVALFVGGRGPEAAAGGPAASAATAAPAEAASLASSSQRILVVRRSGDHDALWLVSPADGAATAAGTLPGPAGRVAVSPNGLNVAYLPASQAPRVWIGYGPKAPKTVSLAAAGVKAVDGLTWISADRILVSGVVSGTFARPDRDRLFVVTVSTGKASAFRDLRGTEPSAAPGVGKVAYVRLTTVAPADALHPDAPLIRESLRILRLPGSGAGRELTYERYRRFADHRAFQEPKLSPSGAWLLTEQTGSDVSVTYSLRESGSGFPFFTLSSGNLPAAAWDSTGRKVAFAATPAPFSQSSISVWVFDVHTGAMVRTPAAAVKDQQITDLAWAADGAIAVGTRTTGSAAGMRRILVAPGDLTGVTGLGAGRLPVWVD